MKEARVPISRATFLALQPGDRLVGSDKVKYEIMSISPSRPRSYYSQTLWVRKEGEELTERLSWDDSADKIVDEYGSVVSELNHEEAWIRKVAA